MIYKRNISLVAILTLCYWCGYAQTKSAKNIKDEVEYGNPLIGTAITGFAKGLDGGGTMPCVNVPFAMTNFVAQTGENKMSRAKPRIRVLQHRRAAVSGTRIKYGERKEIVYQGH